jgi:hypothetical protein
VTEIREKLFKLGFHFIVSLLVSELYWIIVVFKIAICDYYPDRDRGIWIAMSDFAFLYMQMNLTAAVLSKIQARLIPVILYTVFCVFQSTVFPRRILLWGHTGITLTIISMFLVNIIVRKWFESKVPWIILFSFFFIPFSMYAWSALFSEKWGWLSKFAIRITKWMAPTIFFVFFTNSVLKKIKLEDMSYRTVIPFVFMFTFSTLGIVIVSYQLLATSYLFLSFFYTILLIISCIAGRYINTYYKSKNL